MGADQKTGGALGCVFSLVIAAVAFLVPAYIGWRCWNWLGPYSWVFGEGFVWFAVKVLMTLTMVGMGTRFLYAAVMLIGSAVAALFRRPPPK